MRQMIKDKGFLFSLLFAFSLGSCHFFTEKEKIAETSTYVLLIDISDMREETATRNHYIGEIEKVMNRIKPGDAIVALLISEKSVMDRELRVEKRFSAISSDEENRYLIEADIDSLTAMFQIEKDEIMTRLTSYVLYRERNAPQTDILSAVLEAGNAFKQFPSTYLFLYVLSDMEQYDANYNFVSNKITESKTHEIIEKERKNSRGLAKLDGVSVRVAGAESRDSDRYFLIRNFWKEYFKACGATLMDEHYGVSFSGE